MSRRPRRGNGEEAVCGIMICKQLFFVAQPLISIQCLLRFCLACTIIYFYLKTFSFFFVWIDCVIFLHPLSMLWIVLPK